MQQYTESKSIKFSKIQMETLEKLKRYDVNIGQFIRCAIAEKIKREWPEIKERKERIKLPF